MTQKNATKNVSQRERRIRAKWRREGKPGGFSGLQLRLEQSQRSTSSMQNPATSNRRLGRIPRSVLPPTLRKEKVIKALAAFLDPWNHSCRPPNAVGGAVDSTHYRSRRSFPIYASQATGSEGKFFMLCRPGLGATSDPTKYQVAIWKNTVAFPSDDISTSATAISSWMSDIGGIDPRIDNYATALTTPTYSLKMNRGS